MSRRFRPSLPATLVLGFLLLAFSALGEWQWRRAADKSRAVARFDAAPTLGYLPDGTEAAHFIRVTLRGTLDDHRHILVDNRMHRGRAGVHVLTPFTTTDTPRGEPKTVLVNRGWLPIAPDRRALPAVPPAADPVTISGYLDALGRPGATPGGPDSLDNQRWPKLVTYPTLESIATALGSPLYPHVVYLHPDSPAGFGGRDWQPFFVRPARHRAYAVQWFALAAAAIGGWIALGIARGARMNR